MIALRTINRINILKSSITKVQASIKYYCKKIDDDNPSSRESNHTLGDMSSKYKTFKEQDSEVIFDIYEERLKYSEQYAVEDPELVDPFEGINLQRGVTGVFDIEDLITVLKRENAENIFVAVVPNEIKYVDFICIVSGKSQRHMKALAQFVRKVYKQKRHSYDKVPILEGVHSRDWMAIDLGNIALHIFSKEARNIYDLESLWAVGSEYDSEYNKRDEVVEMLERHSIYLKDLQPAS